MAEHDSEVVGGGGMAVPDSVVVGGGVMAEHDSAVVGAAGMAEHDASAVFGGGGMAEHDGRDVGGGGGMAEHDSEVVGGGGITEGDRTPSRAGGLPSAPGSIVLMLRPIRRLRNHPGDKSSPRTRDAAAAKPAR